MQWVALENEISVFASHAHKQHDYLCPECRSILRVRSGPHRQTHFYHLRSVPECRQHKKSQEHLLLQLFLFNSIPPEEAHVERPFPDIKRIADVAWEAKKMIFEIQYSPISLQEASARCADYRSIGYEVMWILHDKRFNRWRMTASEAYLRKQPCYFSNMDKMGKGIIYDQFEVLKHHRRLHKGTPLKVHPILIHPHLAPAPAELPPSLLERWNSWKIRVEGDLLSRISHSESLWIKTLHAIENKLLAPPREIKPSWQALLKNYCMKLLDRLLIICSKG